MRATSSTVSTMSGAFGPPAAMPWGAAASLREGMAGETVTPVNAQSDQQRGLPVTGPPPKVHGTRDMLCKTIAEL
jgi:hypothetical protein